MVGRRVRDAHGPPNPGDNDDTSRRYPSRATTAGVPPTDGARPEHIRRVSESLDAHDRMMQFLQPMPGIPRRYLDPLTAIDGTAHVAVGAFVDDRCVGVGRYIRLHAEPDRAEVAVTVASDHRRRGLARYLMTWLEHHACAAGVAELEVNVAGTSRPAATLMRSIGYEFRFDSGEPIGTLSLHDRPGIRSMGRPGPAA